MRRSIRHWPAALALVLCMALAVWLGGEQRTARLVKLDLGITRIAPTYITHSKDEQARGFVSTRRKSTMRRFNAKQPGRKWSIHRLEAPQGSHGLPTWLVQAKRQGQGTVIFVPVEDVPDWGFPMLYAFVRDRHPELKLPEVAWTQLFVDRVYSGLYLKVALPFDRRKTDGGSGVLRDLLLVQGDRLQHLDTRLGDARGVFLDAMARGDLPRLRPQASLLAWLNARRPLRELTLLTDAVSPHGLTLLPLPVSMSRLFRARHQRPPGSFVDARFRRWQVAAEASSVAVGRLSDADREVLTAALPVYAREMFAALRLHGRLHRRWRALSEAVAGRQASTRALGPLLREGAG